MKFTFENFGYIDSGEVELADLTLICGANNVGKTYLSYAIYGFLKHFINLISIDIDEDWEKSLVQDGVLEINTNDLAKNINSEMPSYSNKYVKKLDSIFNAPSGFFEKSKIRISSKDSIFTHKFPIKSEFTYGEGFIVNLEKKEDEEIAYIFLKKITTNEIPTHYILKSVLLEITIKIINSINFTPFIVTSERTSISIFYKELDKNRSQILNNIILGRDSISNFELNSSFSRYAEPIKDNINTIRDYENIIKSKSFLRKDKKKYQAIFDSLADIIGGSFENKSNQVLYRPKTEQGRDDVLIPVYLASSSTKSLFLIDLYVNCLAQENGLLVIDEPELNLHPDNQRKMAGLLARLVNSGIKVLITTHSDYLIREINNRVMLSNNIKNKEKLMQENNLLQEDILKPKQLAAYTLDNSHTVSKVKVNKFGMDMEIFDRIIANSNNMNDDIYYNIED